MDFPAILIIGTIFLVLCTIAFVIVKRNIEERRKLKPELTIDVESNTDQFCGIKLTNQGSGTAVIKNIQFCERNGNGANQVKTSIDEMFPFNKSYWMSNSSFDRSRDYYLAGGESFYFGKLVKDKVVSKGSSYIKLKDMFDEKIKEINIKVEYNDVFEKKQRPYVYNN